MSKDMRKLMEAYNPTEAEAVDEAIAPGVPGKKTTFVQKSGIDHHGHQKIKEDDWDDEDEFGDDSADYGTVAAKWADRAIAAEWILPENRDRLISDIIEEYFGSDIEHMTRDDLTEIIDAGGYGYNGPEDEFDEDINEYYDYYGGDDGEESDFTFWRRAYRYFLEYMEKSDYTDMKASIQSGDQEQIKDSLWELINDAVSGVCDAMDDESPFDAFNDLTDPKIVKRVIKAFSKNGIPPRVTKKAIEAGLNESSSEHRSGIVVETGNGNAQQKGINFNGTKAAKGDGVLPRKAPKAKTSGIPKHLSTLGDKKIANESRSLIQELNETYDRLSKKGK